MKKNLSETIKISSIIKFKTYFLFSILIYLIILVVHIIVAIKKKIQIIIKFKYIDYNICNLKNANYTYVL